MKAKIGKKIAESFVGFLISLFLAAGSWGVTFYVDQKNPLASDSSSGDAVHPFKTVQKGIESALSGDTVYIRTGEYDLSGLSKYFENGISLEGEDKATTILTNGEKLQFANFLKVTNLTFKNFSTVFYIQTAPAQEIISINIHDCTFEGVKHALFTSEESKGKISNVTILRCVFSDLIGSKISAIFLGYGLISSIKIEQNSFENLMSSEKGCSAIVIGTNDTMETTMDIIISRNYFNSIVGPTGDNSRETHAILAYGRNILIENNIIKNINSGTDHEAIYIKASDSSILNNNLEDCGSGGGGGTICSKGGDSVSGLVISNNVITRNKAGHAIFFNGGTVLRRNYINEPRATGFSAINGYAYGKPVVIEMNSVEAEKDCIRLHDAVGGSIKSNYLISYTGKTIKTENITNISVEGNYECIGYECGILPAPEEIGPSPPLNLRIK